MFRCTECNTEYEIKPDFCDCGNDEFIEVEGSPEPQPEAESYVPAAPSSIFEQNSMAPQREPEEEIEEEKFSFDATIMKKKKVTLALIACSVIVSIILVCSVGNGTPKPPVDPEKKAVAKAEREKLALTIPDVDDFWDSTPPYGKSKASGGSSLPLLNDHLDKLSVDLRKYLVSIGNEFSKNWSKNLISGAGTCVIEFTIDKNGELDKKKIVSKSQNESLNESVSMTLSKVTSAGQPPEDYKGERIRLSFEVASNGKFKMYYP